MLIIRKQQQDAFDRAVARSIECALLTHATRQFVDPVRRMGEPAARALVRKALADAGRYGIEQEYEVSRYLDLMFLLGEDFASDPSLPWASVALAERVGAREKMDRLWQRAQEHLARGSGANRGVGGDDHTQ